MTSESLHSAASRRLDVLGGDGHEHVRGRVAVDAVEEDAEDEQPYLLLLPAVPRVRDLVVTVLVAREHAHWHRLGRHDL